MRHTFSIGDRSGLQAGQSSTRTLFLRSQDFVMCAECGFALSCWNMHGRPWKSVSDYLDFSRYPHYLFEIKAYSDFFME